MDFSNSSSNSTPVVAVRDTQMNAIVKNVITVILCLSINYINAIMVYSFIRHEILRANPRYILYIHLVINDIILMTMLTLIQVLSYIVYTLHVWLCILFIFIALPANLNNPMTLAFMAIECYVSVCFPLRHAQICTVKTTYIVICVIWMISIQSILPDVFVALATEHLDFFHTRVFCRRKSIFRTPMSEQKDVIFCAIVMVIVTLTLFYAYFKILFTAKSATTDAKKARNTVLLHSFQLMLSLLTYIDTPISIVLKKRFPQSVSAIRYIVTIVVNVMPRIVSPMVYGIRDKTLRKCLKIYLFCVEKNICSHGR